MTVENSYLIADDLSTNGVFPKAWIREKNSFALLKDGNIRAVENEILSSKICRCFDCRQVLYEESMFDGQKVSKAESLRRWITAWYQWRHLRSMQQIMTFTLWISC